MKSMDELPQLEAEKPECKIKVHWNGLGYNIKSHYYKGIEIIIYTLFDEYGSITEIVDIGNGSFIDIVNNLDIDFEINISLFNSENIELLKIACKNPNFIYLNIKNNNSYWQDIEYVLKNTNIKSLYLHRCNFNGIDNTLLYFDKIDKIYIYECDIKEKILAKFLNSCLNIKSLYIYVCKFDYFSVKHIIKFIKNTKIHSLNLGIDIKFDYWIMVIMAFQDNKYIKDICFKKFGEYNHIPIEILDALYEVLLVNKNIIYIDLHRFDGGDETYNNLITQKLEENKQLLAIKTLERNNKAAYLYCALQHSEIVIPPNVLNEFLQFYIDLNPVNVS